MYGLVKNQKRLLFSIFKGWNNKTSKALLVSSSKGSKKKYDWSYVCGPGSFPLKADTLGRLVNSTREKFGATEAVVCLEQGIRKTFSEITEDANRLASGFLAIGLNKGDRVGIWGPNVYEWYLTQLAAGLAGLVLTVQE